MQPSHDIKTLVEIMARLRTPETGCAWDLKQTFATIAPYTIEEAYEVADAIARGNLGDLREELGDLLLQVVFHARMAEEQGAFDFGDVVLAITEKLVRRHPHVFGEEMNRSEAAIAASWQRIKRQEHETKRGSRGAVPSSVLDGVAEALPALMRAQKLSQRAAGIGFDWPDVGQVLAKLAEEIAEVEDAVGRGDAQAVAEEIGDVLFTVVNLARTSKVDAETALRAANMKFERRFRFIERSLAAQGRSASEASLEEMEALWQAAKEDASGERATDQDSRRAAP